MSPQSVVRCELKHWNNFKIISVIYFKFYFICNHSLTGQRKTTDFLHVIWTCSSPKWEDWSHVSQTYPDTITDSCSLGINQTAKCSTSLTSACLWTCNSETYIYTFYRSTAKNAGNSTTNKHAGRPNIFHNSKIPPKIPDKLSAVEIQQDTRNYDSKASNMMHRAIHSIMKIS